MGSRDRLGLALALLAASGCSCLQTPAPVPVVAPVCTPTPPGVCCADSDCPSHFFCDVDVTKSCLFQCDVDADCAADFTPAEVRQPCAADVLGCACEQDPVSLLTECVPRQCLVDAECPAGAYCRGGACLTAIEPVASACALEPAAWVTRAGESVSFAVEASQPGPASGRVADYTWASDDAALQPDGPGRFLAQAEPDGGLVRVTAQRGQARCETRVRVLGPVPAGSLRVLVVDGAGGQPVPGAVVQVEGAGRAPADQGVALFDASVLTGAPAPRTVSAFAPGYGALTWLGVAGDDVRLELQPDPTRVGGAEGATGAVVAPGTSDVHLGLAGLSLSGDLIGTLPERLLGPPVPAQAAIGTIVQDLLLPEGEEAGLSAAAFKPGFRAWAPANGCPDGGACGVRSLWALGGDLPIRKLPTDAIQSEGGLTLAELAFACGPAMRHWQFSAVRDLGYPTEPLLADGGPSALVELDGGPLLQDGGLRLSARLVVNLPELPQADEGGSMQHALVLGGAEVPGRGWVVLGMGGAGPGSKLAPANGGVVSDEDVPGQVVLHLAPAPVALGGSQAVVALIASDDLQGGAPASGILFRPRACAAPDAGSGAGLCFRGQLDPSTTFLAVPGPGAYDATNRHFTAPTAVVGANLQRVSFGAPGRRRWDVLGPPGDFTLPAPPPGTDDLASPAWQVQALEVDEGPAGVLGYRQHVLGALDGAVLRFATRRVP